MFVFITINHYVYLKVVSLTILTLENIFSAFRYCSISLFYESWNEYLNICMFICVCIKVSVCGRMPTLRLLASSFFLIHLSACCCGSMHMGKREARVVRMPFWMESSSGGSPSDVHLGRQGVRGQKSIYLWIFIRLFCLLCLFLLFFPTFFFLLFNFSIGQISGFKL